MTKLEKAKEIIKENYKDADCGIFNTRNIVGDYMATVYADAEIIVDICYYHSYFEVFGLNNKEFQELKKYYNRLKN